MPAFPNPFAELLDRGVPPSDEGGRGAPHDGDEGARGFRSTPSVSRGVPMYGGMFPYDHQQYMHMNGGMMMMPPSGHGMPYSAPQMPGYYYGEPEAFPRGFPEPFEAKYGPMYWSSVPQCKVAGRGGWVRVPLARWATPLLRDGAVRGSRALLRFRMRRAVPADPPHSFGLTTGTTGRSTPHGGMYDPRSMPPPPPPSSGEAQEAGKPRPVAGVVYRRSPAAAKPALKRQPEGEAARERGVGEPATPVPPPFVKPEDGTRRVSRCSWRPSPLYPTAPALGLSYAGSVGEFGAAEVGSVTTATLPRGGVFTASDSCVRCQQGQKHSSNGLRRVTTNLADRVQANLPGLMTIHSTQDLKHRLLGAGHPEDVTNKWLKAIHQKPGKYAQRLPYVVLGALIHKVRAGGLAGVRASLRRGMLVLIGWMRCVTLLLTLLARSQCCSAPLVSPSLHRSARIAFPSCCAPCPSLSRWAVRLCHTHTPPPSLHLLYLLTLRVPCRAVLPFTPTGA